MERMTVEQMEARIIELEQELEAAKTKKNSKSSHRKYEVLELLKIGPHTTAELALALDTSKNNIGSLLSYLRKQDEIIIHRNHLSQHYLPETAE